MNLDDLLAAVKKSAYPALGLSHQSYSDAVALACLAHKAQRKDYGDWPYSFHLESVRFVLRDYGIEDNHPLAHAAWLHDTLEDTSVTFNDLLHCFGGTVAGLANAVTGVGPNRAARNADAYRKIQRTDDAVVLKLADRIANVEFSKANSQRKYHMYQTEWDGFLVSLVGCPVVSVAAGDVSEMWQRLCMSLGREYSLPRLTNV
jgi:(p)ppGpp synthase/HD superfamily hydrolase